MPSFAAIGAELKASAIAYGHRKVYEFNLDTVGYRECVLDVLAVFVPPLKRVRKERDRRLLVILEEFAPQILEQLELYHRMFRTWEAENRSYGIGRKETIEAERAAEKKSFELTEQLTEQLTEAGWPYKAILTPGELVFSPYPGHLMTGKAFKYWDEMLTLFRKRAA